MILKLYEYFVVYLVVIVDFGNRLLIFFFFMNEWKMLFFLEGDILFYGLNFGGRWGDFY